MGLFNNNKTKHGTLVVSVVDTVNFNYPFGQLRVTNRSSLGPIFVRVDGVDPAVATDESYVVQSGAEKLINIPDCNSVQIRLVSSFAAAYSIEGV